MESRSGKVFDPRTDRPAVFAPPRRRYGLRSRGDALQGADDGVADAAVLEEVYNTERHLLYVACTRARGHLLVTGVDPASEFLVDLA
jgi:superfamily I DNA/RNA helicase